MSASTLSVPDPGGQQLTFDRLLWPAGIAWPEGQVELLSEITKADANALLRHWGHPLGEWRRPFGAQFYGLAINGTAAAIAVSGSTVGSRSAGFARKDVVELGRVCRSPEHPNILRVMIRLWRDYLAQRWERDYWPVRAAVSYALPGTPGNLYRFDGWEGLGPCKPFNPNGAGYSRASQANQIGDGIKHLWRYVYPDTSEQIPR